MADIGEDLIADLLSSTDARITVVGDRVQQNRSDIGDAYPRIWLARDSSVEEVDLSGTGGITQEQWSVELFAEATEQNDTGLDTVQDMATAVKSRWNGKYGTLGAGAVAGMFVSDQDDDYLYKGIDSAEGVHVAALSVELWRQST